MATKKQANKTWEELESIRQKLADDVFPSIQNTKQELDQYREKLLVDRENAPSIQTIIGELEGKIIQLKEEADQKVTEILKLHNSVFTEESDEGPIKKQFEDYLNNAQKLFSDASTKKGDFDSFYEKVFGEKDEKDQSIGGLKKELEQYSEEYEKLFTKIENLLPAATSAGLAKVFGDKVKEFKRAEGLWTWGFLVSAVAISIYFGIRLWITPLNQTLTDSVLNITHNSPFIVFSVWLLVFIGNRRAENKKLEESYKHKEVMARSFVGYKKHIEELEEETTDKQLLKQHMENLLGSINVNSSDFLNSEGEGHPFWDKIRGKGDKAKQ